jgi:hypothetical protein
LTKNENGHILQKITTESQRMTARFFRKKPITISAIQFAGTPESFREIADWMAAHGAAGLGGVDSGSSHTMHIDTLEGKMDANPGDWIIRGTRGEFYPCRPDIFAESYENAA